MRVSSRFWSPKREARRINRSVRNQARETGQEVLWYEYDPMSSTVDPVYDEGGLRAWKAPFTVKTVAVWRTEGTEVPNDRGLYVVDTVHLVTTIDLARRAGMTNTEDSLRHLNDRFVWDSVVWEVRTFHRAGRLADQALELSVTAVQVKYEELINDPQFSVAVTAGTLRNRTIRELADISQEHTVREIASGD